jgi:hypothetical protein
MKPLTIEERNSIREYLTGLVEDWTEGHEAHKEERAALTVLGDRHETAEGTAMQISSFIHGNLDLVASSVVEAMEKDMNFAKVVTTSVLVYHHLHTGLPFEKIVECITSN